jgi:condensin complex subunit 3
MSLFWFSEDLYLRMRDGLLERLNDKEIGVRAQAATALCKFARTDDPEDAPEDTESGPPLLDSLLDALSHDPTV